MGVEDLFFQQQINVQIVGKMVVAVFKMAINTYLHTPEAVEGTKNVDVQFIK